MLAANCRCEQSDCTIANRNAHVGMVQQCTRGRGGHKTRYPSRDMPKFDARSSLVLWRKRLAYRAARLRAARRANIGPRINRWKARVAQAAAMIARREAQIAPPAPPYKTAAQLNLKFTYPFGHKGKVIRGGGHYSAEERAAGMSDLERLARSFHAYHAGKGWGGISYEALVADDGSIIFGNPMDRKGAAIAAMNTGLVNICVPGTTGDRMTAECKRSIRWLMDNWHTTAVPARHRLPVRARSIPWRGHREWNNNSACPGDMLADYHEAWS